MTFQDFLKEYEKIKLRFPRLPTHNANIENADYSDYVYETTNAYYCFEDASCKDIIYLFDSFKASNSCDGDYVIQSERCYDSVDVVDSNNCTYLSYCARVYNCDFCWDCVDSHDLFGCVHLKMKEYCIFNRQYTEEEYKKKVVELRKLTPEEIFKKRDEIAARFPVTQTHVVNSDNCDYGNQIFYSKNLYMCFDSAYSEDSGYLYDSHHNKNSYDFTQTHHCEFCYECTDGYLLNKCFFVANSARLSDSGFCENCSDSNHLLGCYDLKGQEYCILNRKYSKEEYEKRYKEIMDSMKSAS